jgi:hypothetical protein
MVTITSNGTGGGLASSTSTWVGGDLTSIVLSGDAPFGIDLIKTLSYSVDNIIAVSYS